MSRQDFAHSNATPISYAWEFLVDPVHNVNRGVKDHWRRVDSRLAPGLDCCSDIQEKAFLRVHAFAHPHDAYAQI